MHIPLSIGDTIITNSYSNIYPEGINIGNISSFEKNDDDGFYTVNVSLFEDFNNLKYVYVVNCIRKYQYHICKCVCCELYS